MGSRFTKFFVQVCLVSSMVLACVVAPAARAEQDIPWVTDVTITATDQPDLIQYSSCVEEKITAIDPSGLFAGVAREYDGCVFYAKDYTIARYTSQFGRNGSTYAIKDKTKASYNTVSNIYLDSNFKVSPTSNRFSYSQYNSQKISSVSDLRDVLLPDTVDAIGNVLGYLMDESRVRHYFGRFLDDKGIERYFPVLNLVYSSDGRYAFAWLIRPGHVKIDLETGKSYVITKINRMSGQPLDSTSAKTIAITNDGRFAFMNLGPRLFDTKDCSREISSYDELEHFASEVCEPIFYDVASQAGFQGYLTDPVWLGNEEALRFTFMPFSHSHGYIPKQITISRTQPQPMSRLDYLALGDSYSSGEGDIAKDNGVSHYLPKTDGAGGCHISTRSYPFLLQQVKSIANTKMQSVACSGAILNKDYFGDNASYRGQGNKLKAKSPSEIEVDKANALNDVTPGLTKQIEFVKANKPKVITFTAGGNDVGFSDILKYCATPEIGGIGINTCDYALPNTKLRSLLGDAIQTQYAILQNFIKAVKQASPNTVIYVVGYPSFVSTNSICVNGAALNVAERSMINQSVYYMNSVLKTAAESSGAHYANVEDSLIGGRICEGSEYMTGWLNIIGNDFSLNQAQMFHPNHLGHQKIAESIVQAGFSTSTTNPTANVLAQVPVIPTYFGSASHVTTRKEKLLMSTNIAVNSPLQLQVSAGIFKAGSAVDFTIWSSPTDLGSVTTDSNGVSNALLLLPPDFTPGYHLLVAEGTAPDGNPVRAYQYVDVVNEKSDDIDGDGIKNVNDDCLYITKWYDETNKTNICTESTFPTPTSDSQLQQSSQTNNNQLSQEDSSNNNELVGIINNGQPNQVGDVLGSFDYIPSQLSKNSAKQNTKASIGNTNSVIFAIIGLIVAIVVVRKVLLYRNQH